MIPPAFRLHARLLQEPWYFTVDQVARLDSRQAAELFLIPAQEQAKELERRQPDGRGGTVATRGPADEPTWDDFMANVGMHCRGATLGELQAKFQTVHAAWVKESGGK